ncbi:hypothetical protein BDN72DRAFT_786492 [Pluteus cervinus]|uniref:Uncharacterized protein n=1 Tax=Pluteus cervinus TaxID=181527 RepID=A0ACD3BE74_9AGAR|nr:hypothetical protein BDN72DRAFT_786492 [Pluteus cervinus]
MASDNSSLEKLVNQLKNNDVDIKVEGLTKLQAEFESGVEISDPDALINSLKSCLRTPNQHLTSATLAVLPSLLPLLLTRSVPNANSTPAQSTLSTSSVSPSNLIDISLLRQVLSAFLPAGGIFDRLGDKEKSQVKARETLAILGGLSFRASPSSTSSKLKDDKAQKTPLAIFERALCETGLGSKVWKVREQSVLVLVHIRRKHHLFPIRPYLQLIVDCLEDTDPHVRDCARISAVELFTGPGVTDAARADLKEKMIKKGVRKTIMDGVLSKILSTGSSGSVLLSREGSGSDNGDSTASTKPREYVPPSLLLQQQQGKRPPLEASMSSTRSRTGSQSNVKESSRPASRAAMGTPATPATPAVDNSDVQPVYIASARDLEHEFGSMEKPFEGKETEHNWAAREKAIVRVRGMLKGDVHQRYTDVFLACLKDGYIQRSLKTLFSLRTTVALHTCSLYQELVLALGTVVDPFCETLLTNLLKMAGFTKKITAQQSQVCVTTIILNTSPQPRMALPLIYTITQEKNIQSRATGVAHMKLYLETHGARAKGAIEGSGGLELIEKALKAGLKDANPGVRETTRITFWIFDDIWRDHGRAVFNTLDNLAKKELEKVCPNPNAVAELPPITPAPKKSSVAAAIAASRAKAKAIATAPPSLRHQATSHPPTRRATSPSTSPKSTTRSTSPLRTTSSPPSRSRIVNNQRSVSANAVPTASHVRSTSGGSASGSSASPPSPTEQSIYRRTSSPLAPPPASSSPSRILRKAVQTALPVSPSHSSSGHVSPTPRGRIASGPSRGAVVPISARVSTAIPQLYDDDELLIAQSIPIPLSDEESDGDLSVNLLSFSAPFEMYPPPKSTSRALSFSPRSTESKQPRPVSTTLSSDSVADLHAATPVIVEDALRARAEQAESAAERLLELVEPEDEVLQHPIIPSSLLVGSNNGVSATPKVKVKPAPLSRIQNQPVPVTPVNQARASAIMKQAAMFQDSPVYNGKVAPSLLNVLQAPRNESGWWLKRKDLIAQIPPPNGVGLVDRVQDVKQYIAELESTEAGVEVLQKVALLCIENPAAEEPSSPGLGYPLSPSPFIGSSHSMHALHSEMWDQDRNFERLFRALVQYLDYTRKEEEIEYGLIALWEMLEHQAPYLEGREAELFSTLLRVRYCNKLNVLEATNTIRDLLTTKIEPVYGLTTMHAALRAFSSESNPTDVDADVKAAAYAFGLIALGKFILRLPAEIAEEELPRLKGTLISALNEKASLIVRESAAAAIISAQLVLQDETHLFTLLDGLADDKKNLLTYLFDKHGARGVAARGPHGKDKLEKELRRLDTRTSTPMRPSLGV